MEREQREIEREQRELERERRREKKEQEDREWENRVLIAKEKDKDVPHITTADKLLLPQSYKQMLRMYHGDQQSYGCREWVRDIWPGLISSQVNAIVAAFAKCAVGDAILEEEAAMSNASAAAQVEGDTSPEDDGGYDDNVAADASATMAESVFPPQAVVQWASNHVEWEWLLRCTVRAFGLACEVLSFAIAPKQKSAVFGKYLVSRTVRLAGQI